MSYAELHFHLLPAIDDGPSSLEESVELAAAAAAQGTGTIVTTTHVHPEFNTDVSSLPDRVREVAAKLAAPADPGRRPVRRRARAGDGPATVAAGARERALRWSDAGWETLEHELAEGSVVQINAWSVAGLYGEMVRATALWLLRTAPQAVVASDAHGGSRMPALGLALDALAAARVPDPERLLDAVPNGLLEHGLAVGSNSLAA
jgi:protein-tyrosine phosphatase